MKFNSLKKQIKRDIFWPDSKFSAKIIYINLRQSTKWAQFLIVSIHQESLKNYKINYEDWPIIYGIHNF